MCFVCEALTPGRLWYLQPELHGKRIYQRRIKPVAERYEPRAEKDPGGGSDAGLVYSAIVASYQKPQAEYHHLIDTFNRSGEYSIVLPLEDAEKLVEIAYPIAIMSCVCRKGFLARDERSEDEYSCMTIGVGTYKWERWPERYKGGVRFLSVAEAKSWICNWNKQGMFALTMTAGNTMNGEIVGLCMCDYPSCRALKFNFDYGLNGVMKSHYVAKVDLDKCNACGRCLSRCHFRALTKNVTTGKAHINMLDCAGCGVCQTVCRPKAIELLWRESLPALKDNWLLRGRTDGNRLAPRIEIDATKCGTPFECKKCFAACPSKVFQLQEPVQRRFREALPEDYRGCVMPLCADQCTLCMDCVKVCPAEAITISARQGVLA